VRPAGIARSASSAPPSPSILVGPTRRPTPRSTTCASWGITNCSTRLRAAGWESVYRARQLSLNRVVALKLLLGGEFAGSEFIKRFRREAEAAARLRHPNIVAIHEFGFQDGQQFLAMEYIEGRSLSDCVREQPMPARRAAFYLHAITGAVAFAHEQGVLHRDLKPSNVLIDARTDQPRITDFGLAKQLPPESPPLAPSAGRAAGAPLSPSGSDAPDELTISGRALGSPAYMAPEQAAGRGNIGPAADLYSLGALLYHLLTGRPPFQSDSLAETLRQVHHEEPVAPRHLNPSVPLDLETICLKCLEKDPSRALSLGPRSGRGTGPLGSRMFPSSPARFVPGLAPGDSAEGGRLSLRWARACWPCWSLWLSALRWPPGVSPPHAGPSASNANAFWAAHRDLQHAIRVLELQRAEDAFRAKDSALGVAHVSALLRRDPSHAIRRPTTPVGARPHSLARARIPAHPSSRRRPEGGIPTGRTAGAQRDPGRNGAPAGTRHWAASFTPSHTAAGFSQLATVPTGAAW
jgi:hypothetical protein